MFRGEQTDHANEQMTVGWFAAGKNLCCVLNVSMPVPGQAETIMVSVTCGCGKGVKGRKEDIPY